MNTPELQQAICERQDLERAESDLQILETVWAIPEGVPDGDTEIHDWE